METDTPVAAPAARLYSPGGIGVATFCGTVLAGAMLMARNFRALGDETEARKAIIWGIVAFVAMVVVTITFNVPSWAYYGVPGAMYGLAQRLQGKRYGEHVARGGVVYSNWRALGMGFLWLVPALALLAATALGMTIVGRMFPQPQPQAKADDGLPDMDAIHKQVQAAIEAVEKIDQPVGETQEQRLKRLGLSKKDLGK